MTRTLHKDHSAKNDLVDIWAYSFKTWGEAQAEKYLTLLETGIHALAQAPDRGCLRDQLRSNYWSLHVEHHIIFYTFNNDEVRIRRVLHEVMDVGQHFQ